MKFWDYIRSYDGPGIFNGYWWKDFWYNQISTRIWPRQRWLTSKIPRTWKDKDTLIETCVLECLKNYIEGEEALGKDMCHFQSSQDDSSYPIWQKEFDRDVKKYYEMATMDVPALEKKIREAWDNVPHTDWRDMNKPCDYEKTYGHIDRMEKELYDLQTEIMVWVIKNRNGLWT